MSKAIRVEYQTPDYKRLQERGYLICCQMLKTKYDETVLWIEESTTGLWYSALHLSMHEMMMQYGVGDSIPTGPATFYLEDADTALALRLSISRCFFRGPTFKKPQ